MFGFRDEFDYLECDECGCLQLITIPPDLIKYYPPNYYSYQSLSESDYIQGGFTKSVKWTFKKNILNGYLHNKRIPTSLLSRLEQLTGNLLIREKMVIIMRQGNATQV